MDGIQKGKDLMLEAKRHGGAMLRLGSVLLVLAILTLALSSLSWRSLLIGQVMFVLFVFSAATVFLIYAISQDIRGRDA